MTNSRVLALERFVRNVHRRFVTHEKITATETEIVFATIEASPGRETRPEWASRLNRPTSTT